MKEKVGKSDAFQRVWEQVETELPKVSNKAGRRPDTFTLEFPNADHMQLVATYINAAGTTFSARYDFNITYTENGELSFTYFDDEIDEATYNNGRIVLAGFSPLIDYLESNSFRADWLSPERVGAGNLSRFGGLFVSGDPENYIYGPVSIK